MIGRRDRKPARRHGGRALAVALGALVFVAVAFGVRPADPASADPTLTAARNAALVDRAWTASESLAKLEDELRAAVDVARRGAAAVVAGDGQPGVHLAAAADSVDAARPAAERAAAAVTALHGTARSVASSTSRGPLPEPPVDATPDVLASIAEQLRGTTAAADAFSANRREAEAVVAAFGEALAAMHRQDPRGALAQIERAAAHLEEVRAWEPESGLPTLQLWLATMEALLDASRRAAQSALDGDRGAAEAAVRDWEAAAADAHRADVALGVALAEGGSLVAAAPLRRLAAALAEVHEARARVASLVHPGSARSPSGQAGWTR